MTVVLPRKNNVGLKVEPFTLDATQAGDKEVFLSATPKGAVELVLPNGTTQIPGADFDVVGNRVFWNGLALETLLIAGDKIVILY